ncbi:unnamed protein product, partial [Amoebophrya sp. A25]|eukprot:GSA25T00014118001.1
METKSQGFRAIYRASMPWSITCRASMSRPRMTSADLLQRCIWKIGGRGARHTNHRELRIPQPSNW